MNKVIDAVSDEAVAATAKVREAVSGLKQGEAVAVLAGQLLMIVVKHRVMPRNVFLERTERLWDRFELHFHGGGIVRS